MKIVLAGWHPLGCVRSQGRIGTAEAVPFHEPAQSFGPCAGEPHAPPYVACSTVTQEPLWLPAEQIANRLLHDRAAHLGDRFGERDVFRTRFEAVLRVSALLNSAIPHQRRQPLALQRGAGGMGIEQAYLRDSGCADESRALVEL